MEETSLTDFVDQGEEATGDDPADDPATSEDGDGETGAPTASTADTDSSTPDPSASGSSTQDSPASNPPPPVSTDAVTPAETTAAWSPSPATCAGCGERVAWRYRDGDALVCADCKSWG